jgi:PAS domain S-box-containing protein
MTALDELELTREQVRLLQEALQRSQEALQRSEELLAIAPAFFGFLSLDGKVIDCNGLALAVIEATPEQVFGMHFWEAPWWRSVPHSASQVREAVASAAAGQASHFEIAYWAIAKGVGGKRWVALDIRPLRDPGGTIARIVATGVDITEQQQAQEALRRSEDRLWATIEELKKVKRADV